MEGEGPSLARKKKKSRQFSKDGKKEGRYQRGGLRRPLISEGCLNSGAKRKGEKELSNGEFWSNSRGNRWRNVSKSRVKGKILRKSREERNCIRSRKQGHKKWGRNSW